MRAEDGNHRNTSGPDPRPCDGYGDISRRDRATYSREDERTSGDVAKLCEC